MRGRTAGGGVAITMEGTNAAGKAPAVPHPPGKVKKAVLPRGFAMLLEEEGKKVARREALLTDVDRVRSWYVGERCGLIAADGAEVFFQCFCRALTGKLPALAEPMPVTFEAGAGFVFSREDCTARQADKQVGRRENCSSKLANSSRRRRDRYSRGVDNFRMVVDSRPCRVSARTRG